MQGCHWPFTRGWGLPLAVEGMRAPIGCVRGAEGSRWLCVRGWWLQLAVCEGLRAPIGCGAGLRAPIGCERGAAGSHWPCARGGLPLVACEGLRAAIGCGEGMRAPIGYVQGAGWGLPLAVCEGCGLSLVVCYFVLGAQRNFYEQKQNYLNIFHAVSFLVFNYSFCIQQMCKVRKRNKKICKKTKRDWGIAWGGGEGGVGGLVLT